jgi:hypothetical protein
LQKVGVEVAEKQTVRRNYNVKWALSIVVEEDGDLCGVGGWGPVQRVRGD